MLPSLISNIFINAERRELRSGWQVALFFLVLILCAMAATVPSELLQTALGVTKENRAEKILLVESIGRTTGLIAALAASWLCARGLNNRSLASIGCTAHTGWLKDLGAGIAAAFAMVSLAALLQWAIGGTSFVWRPLSFNDMLIGLPALAFVVFAAAAFEEVMFRGFPLQALGKSIHPAAAALIMSVPFALIHLRNPCHTIFGTINTILAGLWLCAAYFKTRSLWLPTGLHFGWNFFLGSFYGLTVSGVEWLSKYSLFKTDDNGPTWFTGGCYGPEGGAAASIALAAGAIWLLKTDLLKRNPETASYFESQTPPRFAEKYNEES